ncbi:hypothetical protein [Burkholderia multivorans]|uniref:hypothetical protein n=1 Tax=Burkholderia multivorans TaxID=87883 RepID=UPI002158FBF2|nr:hypothetical protein [Burkholderia multivorans]
MEKLDELLREYAQSIRRDDGTAFVHADAIRRLFQDRAVASTSAEAVSLADEQRRVLVEVAQTFKGTDRRRAVLNELAGIAAAPQPARAATPDAEAVNWRELSRRLYVELFHCDQQMRSTRDEDGEPHWTQSAVVRDVLADAKAALDGAPQPAQADAPAEAREPHSDDVSVDSFAAAMKHKLALARAKGRGGWETCSPADLSRMLREHVEKGDPRDVANFCMMLWHHGSPIVSAPADSGEARLTDEPSLTNPLTPYGMLVRALRIVTGTVLGDMAQHLGCSPAALSAVEFGRKPLTAAMVADTAAYFASVGIPDTLHALSAAWRAHALLQGTNHAE